MRRRIDNERFREIDEAMVAMDIPQVNACFRECDDIQIHNKWKVMQH